MVLWHTRTRGRMTTNHILIAVLIVVTFVICTVGVAYLITNSILHSDSLQCQQNCKSLNMEPFTLSGSRFAGLQCWCLKDNNPTRIW
jgi:hypothetical protein